MNPPACDDVRPPTILIVAAEPIVLHCLAQGLELLGLRVLHASGSAEAFKILQAEWEAVSLALIDRCLPGYDGFQTMLALLESKPLLRCCILTDTVPLDREELWLVPSVSFLGMPFTLQALSVCVRQLLGEPRQTREELRNHLPGTAGALRGEGSPRSGVRDALR